MINVEYILDYTDPFEEELYIQQKIHPLLECHIEITTELVWITLYDREDGRQ